VLEMISGNTGYIRGAVNIGVYQHGQGECTIVDAGLDQSAAKTVLKALKKEGLRLRRVIITHAHADHTGGLARLLVDMPAEICATAWEAAFIENPMLEPFYLYSAHPLDDLQTKFFLSTPCSGVRVVAPGFELDDLTVVDLGGHSPGQIGIHTKDDVLLVADAFFSETVLEKYYIPYFAHIEQAKDTLTGLLAKKAAFYLPAHGALMNDIHTAVQANLDRLTAIEVDMIRYLNQGDLTKEEIISCFVRDRGIDLNMGQFHLVAATVSAFIAYLKDQNKIGPAFSQGFLKWSCAI
jgi:glyoxylase-like metal-dependent hydrolase (beta-lactamase superfamily II)